MTKAKMIETIQQREAELWLKMTEYKYHNAPLYDGYDAYRAFEDNDIHLSRLRFEWSAVWELMETLGIESAWDLQTYKEAREMESEIWKLTHNIA